MKLNIQQILDFEICHFYNNELKIFSKFNRVFVENQWEKFTITLPGDGVREIFGRFRLLRRALRLDKCNVIPVGDNIVIIRNGKVYYYDSSTKELRETLTLKNCRVVLHQSICLVEQKILYFGEYGNNAARNEVPVYRSLDGGKSWETVYTFEKDKIKHIHGCYYDPTEDKIWVLTGDFKNECYMLIADRDFKNIRWVGDGQQVYRACNLFFEQDFVHWMMDSPLESSYHIKFNRKTSKIEKKHKFDGPVWYIKRLHDGYYLAATAQEIGPGVLDNYAHLMVSRDLENWDTLYKFKHDGFPKLFFKFGVIGFPEGKQKSDSFYIFIEALKRFDGKTLHCAITD